MRFKVTLRSALRFAITPRLPLAVLTSLPPRPPCRVRHHCEGRINDLALIVGGNLCHEKMKNDQEMQEWASTFERYLNLAHFLCHRSNSPVRE